MMDESIEFPNTTEDPKKDNQKNTHSRWKLYWKKFLQKIGYSADAWTVLAKIVTHGCNPNSLADAVNHVKESAYFKAFGNSEQAPENLLAMRSDTKSASSMLSFAALIIAALSLANAALPAQNINAGMRVTGRIMILVGVVGLYYLYTHLESSRDSALSAVLTYIKCNPDKNPIFDESAKAISLPNNKKIVYSSMIAVTVISALVAAAGFCGASGGEQQESDVQQQDLNSVYVSLSTQGIETRAQLDAASGMLKEKKDQTADSGEKGKLDTRIDEVDQASADISKALGADHSSPNLASSLGGLAKSILDGKIKLADSLIDLGGVTLSPTLSLTPTLSVDLGDQVKEYLSNISTELTNISNNTDSLSASFDSTEINKVVEELTEIENKYNIDLSSVKNSVKQIHNSSSSTTIINNSFNGGRDACACDPQNDSGCGCG